MHFCFFYAEIQDGRQKAGKLFWAKNWNLTSNKILMVGALWHGHKVKSRSHHNAVYLHPPANVPLLYELRNPILHILWGTVWTKSPPEHPTRWTQWVITISAQLLNFQDVGRNLIQTFLTLLS